MERLLELRVDALEQNNFNAVLRAERQLTSLIQARMGLMQEAGLVPRDLGVLRHVRRTKEVVNLVADVLRRVEEGEVQPGEARREVLRVIRGGREAA